MEWNILQQIKPGLPTLIHPATAHALDTATACSVHSRRDIKVGRTIQDVIVYLIRVEKNYCELNLDRIKLFSVPEILKNLDMAECSIHGGIDYFP